MDTELWDITKSKKRVYKSIAKACYYRTSVRLDEESASAARSYYLHIIDKDGTSFHDKKRQIYRDLVIGCKPNTSFAFFVRHRKQFDESFKVLCKLRNELQKQA